MLFSLEWDSKQKPKKCFNQQTSKMKLNNEQFKKTREGTRSDEQESGSLLIELFHVFFQPGLNAVSSQDLHRTTA
jgi:hypothetical protein